MKGAYYIIETLEKAGFSAYIVGGAVRDYLLGKTPKDIDIVTQAKPEEVMEIVTKAGFTCTDLVGKSFGVVVVKNDYGTYEVATFRKERYGEDAHRPEEITYADTLEEDVLRRDFTINGLAMDRKGDLWDYVGGEEDIQKKIVRTIGRGKDRFCEDALRLFRACRFVGQLGFNAHKSLLEAMEPAFYRVEGLSLERVKIELEKLLLSPFVARGMDILVQSGLANQSCRLVDSGRIELIPILPELHHLVGLPQNRQFHKYDGWYHTLVALQNTPSDLTIRWGTLLHDVAKGLPHIRDEVDGRLRDHGHDGEGAHIAKDILLRLRYKESFAERVSWLVQNHMRFHYFAVHQEADPWKWVRKEARSGHYRNSAELVEASRQLMEVCVGDVIGCGRPLSATDGTRAFGECMQEIARQTPIHTRDLHYKEELITLAGDKARFLLPNLLKKVQNGQIENNHEALMDAAQRWFSRQAGKKSPGRDSE